MNKRFTFLFALVLLSLTGFCQISAGLYGNYTMYKGDFGKSTPGVGVEVGYNLMGGKGGALSYTKGFAITQPSTIISTDGLGNTKTTAAELSTSFSTISLMGQYRFIGDDDKAFGLHGRVGASYVIATTKENEKEAIPTGYTAFDKIGTQSDNGLTINLGLGAQYKFGNPVVFFNGGIALPANKVNDATVANYIPAQFTFNLGVRIGFGESKD